MIGDAGRREAVPLEDKPGVLKVPFAGGIAVLELPEPGALIVVKTILPAQGTA